MLRIEIDRTSRLGTTLRLSGAVVESSLASLRDAVDGMRGVPKLALDLAGVTGIDRAAIQYLQAVTRDGIRLRNARGFVSEWLKAERRSRVRRIACLAAVVLAIAALARAEEPARTESDDWRFRATVYGYLPKISADMRLPSGSGPTIEVSGSDLIRHLEFTFMGAIEVAKGDWGAFANVLYMNVGGSESRSRNFSLGGSPLPASVTADVALDVKAWVTTFAATRRVFSTPNLDVELLAGARMLDAVGAVDFDLSANVGPLTGPARSGSAEVKLRRWDGIGGMRGRLDFGPEDEWFVPLYFDVGTGESKLTYQVLGGLGRSFGWFEVVGVWRFQSWKFDLSDKLANLELNGPGLGISIPW